MLCAVGQTANVVGAVTRRDGVSALIGLGTAAAGYGVVKLVKYLGGKKKPEEQKNPK
jgi:hypothetical protein